MNPLISVKYSEAKNSLGFSHEPFPSLNHYIKYIWEIYIRILAEGKQTSTFSFIKKG